MITTITGVNHCDNFMQTNEILYNVSDFILEVSLIDNDSIEEGVLSINTKDDGENYFILHFIWDTETFCIYEIKQLSVDDFIDLELLIKNDEDINNIIRRFNLTIIPENNNVVVNNLN